MKQTTFASPAFDRKKKQPRRERFLAEMEAVVPWAALLGVVEPHYLTTGSARSSADTAADDAAHLLHAAVVRAVGPGNGRRAVRDRVDAPLCPVRSESAKDDWLGCERSKRQLIRDSLAAKIP
jgi:hypothetical protein